MKEKQVLDIQRRLNEKLAACFNANKIKNVRLTSFGNSIASGYSMARTTKPLLLRNESIEEVLNSYDIELERHNFARAQNNNDEHLFEWLTTNIKETEINKMNRSDYEEGPTSMVNYGLDKIELEEFYPLELENDIGLKELLTESDPNLANILIYNGCTGSFLDNVTRNGKLTQMLTYGIKRDIKGLEATLKYIQANNRKNNTNTQVYICGAPNFLGLNIQGIINSKLKKVADQYANVTYVKPVKSKFIYRNYESNKYQPDIHYDEEEYLEFNNNILESIFKNYEINKAMINIDRICCQLSNGIELENPALNGNKELIQKYIDKVLSGQAKALSTNEQKELFYHKVRKYLLERQPYDFYYLGKNNIKDVIDNSRKTR